MASMFLGRDSPAHAVLADRLFIIGGRDEQVRYVNSVECYDPSTNEWKMVAPLIVGRFAGAACALNGSIYVVGGHWQRGFLGTVERYDPEVNLWTQVNRDLLIGFCCLCSLGWITQLLTNGRSAHT